MRYGNLWRQHRRVFTENLRGATISQYHPLHYKKVHRLTSQLFTKPGDFFKHTKLYVSVHVYEWETDTLHRFAMSVPMALMYGYEIETFDDPAIVAAETSIKLGAKLLLPGATIANIFPVLLKLPEWVPGTGFKKIANHVYHLTQETKRIPLEFVKKMIVGSILRPQVLVYLYARRRKEHLCLLWSPGSSRRKWLSVRLRRKSRWFSMWHTRRTEVCNIADIFRNKF